MHTHTVRCRPLPTPSPPWLVALLLLGLLTLCPALPAATFSTAERDSILPISKAQSLFGDLQQLVFQVRVIDIGSGDKYSLGSGFQVSVQGDVATNFHVVSAYVNEPEKYRLELVSSSGAIEPVTLRAIDVIHDLAVLHSHNLPPRRLPLAITALNKGGRIYSIGNPLDLGMTIIEGNYNGLVKRSRYQKILFSGSLNSGMSGGPTVNEKGEVIGVNVSKGGEQISFLVPVAKLRTLLAALPDIDAGAAISTAKEPTAGREASVDFKQRINRALNSDQQAFVDSLLAQPFAMKKLGELEIPGDLHPSLRCWGHSEDTEKIRYSASHQHCRSDDSIFLQDDLVVGSFNYDAEWISTEQLNRWQFYQFVETRFTHTELGSTNLEKHVTQYTCHTDFVKINDRDWKASSCLRAYKEFDGLFDALLLMALVESNDSGAIIKLGASAVSQSNAQALFKAIMESVQWNR